MLGDVQEDNVWLVHTKKKKEFLSNSIPLIIYEQDLTSEKTFASQKWSSLYSQKRISSFNLKECQIDATKKQLRDLVNTEKYKAFFPVKQRQASRYCKNKNIKITSAKIVKWTLDSKTTHDRARLLLSFISEKYVDSSQTQTF